jgi:hypothetical protein
MFIIPAEEAEKHLQPPQLTQVLVSPSHAQIEPRKKQAYAVEGLDQFGRECHVSEVAYNQGDGRPNGELMVIDVSHPWAPFVTGSLLLGADSSGIDLEVAGRRAYVADTEDGWQTRLWVIDVSDPSNPAALSVVDEVAGEPLRSSRGMARSGHFLYVAGANGEDGLMVFDVAGCGASVPPDSVPVPPTAD